MFRRFWTSFFVLFLKFTSRSLYLIGSSKTLGGRHKIMIPLQKVSFIKPHDLPKSNAIFSITLKTYEIRLHSTQENRRTKEKMLRHSCMRTRHLALISSHLRFLNTKFDGLFLPDVPGSIPTFRRQWISWVEKNIFTIQNMLEQVLHIK